MRILIKAAVRILLIISVIWVLKTLLFEIILPVLSATGMLEEFGSPIIVLGIIMAVTVILGGILWWKTDWLVKILTGSAEDTTVQITGIDDQTFRSIMVIFGTFLLITATPELIGLLSRWIHNAAMYPDATTISEDAMVQYLARYLTTILIGVILIVGKDRFVRLKNRMSDILIKPEPESLEDN